MPTPSGTRREFIQTTAAAAAAFTIVPRHVLGGQKFVAPSDKVNIALIGAGGQGRTNARALFQEEDAQIIALADPAESWDLEAWSVPIDSVSKIETIESPRMFLGFVKGLPDRLRMETADDAVEFFVVPEPAGVRSAFCPKEAGLVSWIS